MPSSAVIAAGLQTGAVVLGYYWGAAIYCPRHAPSIYTACALLAVLVILVGASVALVRPRVVGTKYCATVSVMSLLYSVGVVLSEPFLHVSCYDQIIGVALVLVPMLLAIDYLVRGHAWASVAGVTLFVFTSSAMIASNANASVAGSGFFSSWIY